MYELSDIIILQKTIDPKVVVEIGSLHGNDMKILSDIFKNIDINIIEAHPVYSKKIKQKYPKFKVYEFAATNKDCEIEFNGVNDGIKNQGISSIHDRNGVNYTKYFITGKRMDSFMINNGISSIDILKIDVEGHSMEVLEGFGDEIKKVKCIHIENEHIPVWSNQITYSEVEKYLIDKGFILTAIKSAWPQTDSVWIRKDLYNKNWWK
jgi:FkbM family methyltransferase